MSKKRSIISYDKLTLEQKKQLLVVYPDGFSSGMTMIKTPTGESLNALFWETEEIIYLIKLPAQSSKIITNDDDDDDTDDDLDEIPKIDGIKDIDLPDDDDDEEEDDYGDGVEEDDNDDDDDEEEEEEA